MEIAGIFNSTHIEVDMSRYAIAEYKSAMHRIKRSQADRVSLFGRFFVFVLLDLTATTTILSFAASLNPSALLRN